MATPWTITLLAFLIFGQEPLLSAKAQGIPSATQPAASQANGGLISPSPFSAQELDELLRLVTGNNTPEARRLGARKLLESGSTEAVDRLAVILRASPPDPVAQLAVCQAIASAEQPLPSLIDPLAGLLGAQQPEVHEPVINALRRFDFDLVLERLQPLVFNESMPVETRLAAIAAFGAMGEDIRSVATLVELTRNGSSQIRLAALAALAQATGVEHPDAAAAAGWWQQRETISQADWLVEVQARRLSENRRLRAERQLLTSRLAAAYRDLYLHTPESDRPRRLLSLLIDEWPEVRDLGLDLVNTAITDRKDVTAEVRTRLTEMISDPQPALRLKVVQIIGDLRLASAVSRLIKAASVETDHRVRAAVVDALGRLGGAQVVPALVDCLDDEVPSVAAHASIALASVARSLPQDDQALVQSIAAALTDRFTLLTTSEEELREKLLDAMTRIGAESFRPIFKAEMSPDRSVRIRRAAVTGLAVFADLSAADDILPLASAAEPEIRLAAVAALGRCGRRETDLAPLASRLDAKSESDPAVRQRAWESYLAIAERLSPQDQLRIAEQFAKPDDKTAQRQRLELLGALRASAQRFEQLKSKKADKRLDLLEAMADAHVRLGEFAAAAACLTQASELEQGAANGRHATLAARSIAVLLVGHEDEAAIQRIKDLLGPEGQEDQPASALFAQTALDEAKARADAVVDAATFTDAVRLLDLLLPFVPRFGGDFEQRLAAFRDTAKTKRAAAIDALLASLAVDGQAETRLAAFGAHAVLSRIHASLTSAPPTSAPAVAFEDRLVQFARRLAPDWPGYVLDAPPADRAAALEKLKAIADAAASQRPSRASTTAPASSRPASPAP